MAEKLDEVKTSMKCESNILLWLQTELNNHGIPHAKQYGQYLIFLLSNHVYISRNKVKTEVKNENKHSQMKKPRRFLLSRQRSKSFNSPDDAAIKHLQYDQSPHLNNTDNINMAYFSIEAAHFLNNLGCLDKNWVTFIINELVKRLSTLRNPYMMNPYSCPILPSPHLGLPLINPYLLKPISHSEKDLYYSAFPALVPGLQHRVSMLPYPFNFDNSMNNPASLWLSGSPLFSKEKTRSSEDVDEGFAEDVQDLHLKRNDLVDTLNIEVNKSQLSRRDERWKPLIKTTRQRNAQSCSFPQKSQCYIYDLQYDEDRVLNSSSMDALNIDSDKKEENEMLELLMKAVDEMKEEVSEHVEEDDESEKVLDNFKASSSSCCDLRWVDTHGAGVPAIITFSEQTQSSSRSILYQPQPDTTSQDEISASCHIDLLSDPNKSLSRIWERQLYKRRLSGSIGFDGRVIRNSRKVRTVSCSEPLEESSSLLSKLKESCDDSCLPPLPASALQAADLEKLWVKQSPIDKSKRACSFLLRGRCRKEDCQFAHNLRDVTCRFWQAGHCFKGDDCPFMHGYYFLRVPSKR